MISDTSECHKFFTFIPDLSSGFCDGSNLTLTQSFCEWLTLFSNFWIIHLVAPEIWCWLTIDDAMTIQCPGVGPEHSWCVDVERTSTSYQVSCSSRTEPPLFLYPPTHTGSHPPPADSMLLSTLCLLIYINPVLTPFYHNSFVWIMS